MPPKKKSKPAGTAEVLLEPPAPTGPSADSPTSAIPGSSNDLAGGALAGRERHCEVEIGPQQPSDGRQGEAVRVSTEQMPVMEPIDRTHFDPPEKEGERERNEEWEDLDDFAEFEHEEEKNEERTARLEAEELERQLAQKKRMLDGLAASQKAGEYRRRADEARKTLEKIQEEIDMLHQAEGMSRRPTPPGDLIRAS
ncbi:uncharacterized protein LOC133896845 [Phragmites australis]|uniref:uncharacterized protein LOC133896845 n=1 Tax=Phragmites australis TaxID=29695 RepID=UPI002D7A0694|nr:uncharacterized protein LOC133896845 [Phragmites australis]